MQNALKRTYSIKKEKVQRNQYSGFIPLNELGRLKESVVSLDEDIWVEFQIFEGYMQLPEIKGDFKSRLTVQCQRCMGDFALELKHPFHFYIASNMADEEEVDGLETVLNEGDELDLYHLIEDEAILNLPLIPMHETDCNEYLLQQAQEPAVEETKKNPFEVLKELKKSN